MTGPLTARRAERDAQAGRHVGCCLSCGGDGASGARDEGRAEGPGLRVPRLVRRGVGGAPSAGLLPRRSLTDGPTGAA